MKFNEYIKIIDRIAWLYRWYFRVNKREFAKNLDWKKKELVRKISDRIESEKDKLKNNFTLNKQ